MDTNCSLNLSKEWLFFPRVIEEKTCFFCAGNNHTFQMAHRLFQSKCQSEIKDSFNSRYSVHRQWKLVWGFKHGETTSWRRLKEPLWLKLVFIYLFSPHPVSLLPPVDPFTADLYDSPKHRTRLNYNNDSIPLIDSESMSQWASLHNTSTLEPALLNGMQPSLILWILPAPFPALANQNVYCFVVIAVHPSSSIIFLSIHPGTFYVFECDIIISGVHTKILYKHQRG